MTLGRQSGHIPDASREVGPLGSSSNLENTQYKANFYVGFSSFPISLITPFTLPLLLPGITFQLSHLHPIPFSGSALGRIQTKMGQVAGDREAGGIVV